jgi:hypothetical protein
MCSLLLRQLTPHAEILQAFCLFFTMPLPDNVLCFVSTFRGIELLISPHFDFFISDFSAFRRFQSNLI